ncbi:MAG: hypothetical protein MHPSP_000820, partial [Paramarteilia canceri]
MTSVASNIQQRPQNGGQIATSISESSVAEQMRTNSSASTSETKQYEDFIIEKIMDSRQSSLLCYIHDSKRKVYVCTSCRTFMCQICSESHKCYCPSLENVAKFSNMLLEKFKESSVADVNIHNFKNILNRKDSAGENVTRFKFVNDRPNSSICDFEGLEIIMDYIDTTINSFIKSVHSFADDYKAKLLSDASGLSFDDIQNSPKNKQSLQILEEIVEKFKSDENIENFDLDKLEKIYEISKNLNGNFNKFSPKPINSNPLDKTKESEKFDLIFQKEIVNMVNSNVIINRSEANQNHQTLVSPSSVVKQFGVSGTFKSMSLNEYVAISFGQICAEPGMSPTSLNSAGVGQNITSPNKFRKNFQDISPINEDISINQNGDFMDGSMNEMDIRPFFPRSTDFLDKSHSDSSLRKSLMQIKKKFGVLGPHEHQFNSPHGFCLDNDCNILIANTNNHKILFFSIEGDLMHHFGRSGKEDGHLWYPRKIAIMPPTVERQQSLLVVCDRGNDRSRMQLFTLAGHYVKKIKIQFIDIVASVAVNTASDGSQQIIVVDSVNPTVYVISDSGDILRYIECSEYMKEPSDLAVYNGMFFICDFKGHQVVVFNEDGTYKDKFGGETVTNYPNGIDILSNGNILVGDSHGNKFHIVVYDQSLTKINEFECPFVKVSRCCGLKVTDEGSIVTLAKNNHHILIMSHVPFNTDHQYEDEFVEKINANGSESNFKLQLPNMMSQMIAP